MSKSLKNISVVASATMVSRVLGLARDALTAAVFGTGALASAFFTAFQLPNLFRRLLGEGALTAALVPTLNDELTQRQRAGAFAVVNQVASWLLVVCAGIVGAAVIFFSQPEWIAALGRLGGAEADTIGRWQMAAELAVVLFPYLIFVCVAAVLSGALQTLGRFAESAWSSSALNVSIIGLLAWGAWGWGGTEREKMNWLCAGVLLGGFLQMAVPAWGLMREGWRPRLDLGRDEPLRGIVRLMGPTIFGSAIYLINMTVTRFIGLSLNDAAVSVLNLAGRLMELPIGVFAVAVSTVVFPLISRYAALGDQAGLTTAYRKGMRLILVINVPAAVGLALLSEPIVRLLFQRGAFTAESTQLMLPVLMVSAVGLPFLSFVSLTLRAFYAQKDTATPVRAAVWSFLVNVVLSFALMGPLGTTGLALAGTAAVVVQAVYLQAALTKRQPGLGFGHLLDDLGKIIAATAVMGAAVWVADRGWLYLNFGHTLWGDALRVLIVIGVGVAVYAATLWKLRLEQHAELEELLAKFKAKLGRKA